MATDDEQSQLLEAVFSNAFGPVSGIRKVVVAPNESPNSANPSVNPDIPQAPEVITTNEESENYRQEYDNLVRDWRAESAVNRRKAGEERNRWEAIRASEREESQRTGKKTIRDSWEQLDDSQIAGPPNHRFPDSLASPSPADVRDKVSGESEGGTGRGILQSVLPPPQGVAFISGLASSVIPSSSAVSSKLDDSRHSDSHKWEEIPSMESSYPSLSYPSNADTPSPQSPAEKLRHDEGPRTEVAPASATLSIFDSSLTRRTRALAFVSSLAINFVIPFVNGVMLGFGEIFAKTMLGRFGWSVSGYSATAVGIGAAPSSKRKER